MPAVLARLPEVRLARAVGTAVLVAACCWGCPT